MENMQTMWEITMTHEPDGITTRYDKWFPKAYVSSLCAGRKIRSE